MVTHNGKVVFRLHAIERMFKRGILHESVLVVLAGGEVIEDYPNDAPYPSALLLSVVDGRPLHVVAAHDRENGIRIVITVYEPDSAKWEPDFKRRKS